jgi:parallel beta-helix repeat protein
MRDPARPGAILPVLVVLVVGLWLAAPAATASPRPASSRATCPAISHSVTVSASTMQAKGGLQGLIDACPTGTTFNLPGGSFPAFATIYPKDDDVLNGAGTGTGGTVLLGSKTLPSSNFSKDKSGDWFDHVDVKFDTRTLAQNDDPLRKNCASGYYPQVKPNAGVCDYPDLLYLDGAWLTRTLNSDPTKPCPGPLGAGKYCINYDSLNIYLGSDPTGHTITYSGQDDGTGHVLRSAIENISSSDPSITGVTIKNLVVSQYANTNLSGGALNLGDGWTASNVVSSYNHGCSLSIGGKNAAMPKLVQSSTLTYNGQAGFCGVNAGTTFDHNTVTYNNQDFWSVPNGAGGGKFSAGGPITVTNSVFTHNNGNGLGFDVGEQNMTVTGNTFDDNVNFDGGGHGLHIEVSCYGTVTGNEAHGNDRVGLYVINSHDITVTGNTVGPNGTAELKVQTTNRAGSNDCGKQNQATNDVSTNNTVTLTLDSQSGLMNKTSCTTCVVGSTFAGNTYLTGGNCSADLWTWYTGSSQVTVTWGSWKTTYGQDTAGSCS